ncbi:MAG: LysR family transcriptional regulator, partial [Pseudomonadota bacterium]
MSRHLPPLGAVRVFEACARHLSFTRAAEELAVTHGAVSKQIATLEDFIGAQLFLRVPGGVELTDEGRSLRDAVTPALTQLETAFARLRRTRPGERRLRIATVASFAAAVLVPHWQRLTAALEGYELMLSTSDRPLNLLRESADLAIRYGTGDWAGVDANPLLPGRLLAVGPPDGEGLPVDAPRIQSFAENEWLAVATYFPD